MAGENTLISGFAVHVFYDLQTQFWKATVKFNLGGAFIEGTGTSRSKTLAVVYALEHATRSIVDEHVKL